MFIKILMSNCNGKIEFTAKELENIIEEAVNKALAEKCRNCYKNSFTYGTSLQAYNNNDVAYINDSNFTTVATSNVEERGKTEQ